MAFPFDSKTDPAAMAQALERLMKQRQLGFLGQMSGDRVIARSNASCEALVWLDSPTAT